MYRKRNLKFAAAAGAGRVVSIGAATLSLMHGGAAYAQSGEAGEAGTAGAAAAAQVEPWPESRSQESYSAYLDKVFEGEAGENGWGVNDLTKSVSFPALTGSEIQTLFSGNSMSRENSYGLYYGPDGHVKGWIKEQKNLTGSWRVKGDELCVELPESAIDIGCHNVVLAVDTVLLFRPEGGARFVGTISSGDSGE